MKRFDRIIYHLRKDKDLCGYDNRFVVEKAVMDVMQARRKFKRK